VRRRVVVSRALAVATVVWFAGAFSGCAGHPAFAPAPTADWGPYKTVVHEAMAATLAAGRPTSTATPLTQPGRTARPVPHSPSPSQTLAPSPTPTEHLTPTAQPSATPEETAPPECEPAFRFLGDVTIPDGSIIGAGQPFTKTWAVRNTGICHWGAYLELRHVGGHPLGSAEPLPLPDTSPGERAELSLEMRAPDEPGTYRSDWRLCEAEGECFGPALYAEIVVSRPAEGE